MEMRWEVAILILLVVTIMGAQSIPVIIRAKAVQVGRNDMRLLIASLSISVLAVITVIWALFYYDVSGTAFSFILGSVFAIWLASKEIALALLDMLIKQSKCK